MKKRANLLTLAVALVASCYCQAQETPPDIQVIHQFAGPADGGGGVSGLVEGNDGVFYGVCPSGGNDGLGVAFTIRADGSNFRVLRNFSVGEGAVCPFGLLLAGDGLLYSTTGFYLAPSIFCMDTNGSGFKVLRTIARGSSECNLLGTLTECDSGALIGAAEGFLDSGSLARINKDGSGFTVLTQFGSGVPKLFAQPPLTRGNDGGLYGVTSPSSQALGTWYGMDGVLFRTDGNGSGFTNLLDLGASGYIPGSGPILAASDGFLYGTAYSDTYRSKSILWRVGLDGKGFTVLRSFENDSIGDVDARIVEGPDGKIYGVANISDASTETILLSTLFRLNKDGTDFRYVWQDFCNQLSGFNFLMVGRDGYFYGTTRYGGIGQGTLIRFLPGVPPQSPTVSDPGRARQVPVGSNIRLGAGFAGAGPMTAQWYFNGQLLAGMTNSLMSITNLKSAGFGTYSLSVSNAFGVASTSVQLSPPPEMTLSLTRGQTTDSINLNGLAGLWSVVEGSTNCANASWNPASVQFFRSNTVSVTIHSDAATFFYRGRYLGARDFDVDSD